MNEKRHRLTRRFGPWCVAVFLLAASLAALAMGAAPRYIEELRIGGGYGDSADGGADFERDGDILTDGTLSIGGEGLLSVNNGSWLNLSPSERERRYVGYQHYGASQWLKVVEIDGTNATAWCNAHLHISIRQRLGANNRAGFADAYFSFSFDATPAAYVPVWTQFRHLGSTSSLEFALKEKETETGAKWEVWCYADTNTHILANAEYYSNDYSAININWDLFGVAADTGTDVPSNTETYVDQNLTFDSDDGMVKFGDSQDFQLRYELDGSDHFFKVQDGSGNDMLTVLDNGTVGQVGVTGTLDVDGRIQYVNSGVVFLDGVNPTPVDFTDEGGIYMPDATYAVLLTAETTGNPITATWRDRTTTGFMIEAWNVSTGNPSTSSTLRVSWMVVDQ